MSCIAVATALFKCKMGKFITIVNQGSHTRKYKIPILLAHCYSENVIALWAVLLNDSNIHKPEIKFL